MAILDVLQFPDPRLRRRCEPVEKITDELRQLAADMIETMYDEPGIGLAAPQVGVPLRLVVVDTEWTEEGSERSPLVLVNPEIVLREGKITWTEGCLSVPDFTADVERAERVVLRATDLDGNEIREDATGLRAVCFQHELDHLDGVLFIDRISRLKRDLYVQKRKKALREAGAAWTTSGERPPAPVASRL
ncbi:MAG TPA: peptide deformylase [Myxococcota bacterium]|jgi:peptide deformylase